MKKPRRKPLGSEWRLGLDSATDPFRVNVLSYDYRRHRRRAMHEQPGDRRATREAVDEFVLVLGDECIHIERLDERSWYVALGEEKRTVWVDRNGKLKVGEMYK